jgi:peptide/nickel transport system ATP-binding protein
MTLDLTDVTLTYPDGDSRLTALDHVDLAVGAGQLTAVVGPSGSGKSSLLAVAGTLVRPDSGSVVVDGRDVTGLSLPEFAAVRRDQVGIVFQQPNLLASLTALEQLEVRARVAGHRGLASRAQARELLDEVGLAAHADRRPHQLSGGQRQRVNIARALVLDPKLLVLDEPVSALDKSVQAQVLNLLQDLKAERALTYVLISHDLNVIEYVSDRVLVMYLGEVVETGTAEALSQSPKHPYTQALFASAPSMDPDRRMDRLPITGDPPNAINPPSGCRFRTRCPFAMPRCAEMTPPRVPVSATHEVACYLYEVEPASIA